VLLLAALSLASAQVTVEVTQDQDQYLTGEALPVAVRITNRSGQALKLGAADDWLTFSMESREGRVVPSIGDPRVRGEFTLESSRVAIKHVDLAPYFSADQSGRYQIVASVRIPGWDREVASPPRYFDIVDGSTLWEQDFGVPASSLTNTAPEVRKYSLQQANYIRGQLRLYLRLSDASGRTLRVLPVGPVLSFSRPEPRVDSASSLHLLYQNGPRSFSYTAYNTDGELIARQTYDYAESRPRLGVKQNGEVVVMGGARRITLNDVPPPKSALTPNLPAPPSPPPRPAPASSMPQ